MGIYTRRGDTGETALANGMRVRKDSVRVEAYGTIDEAGAALGVARTAATDSDVSALLRFLQQRLMNCAAHAADPDAMHVPERQAVSPDDIVAVERMIDLLADRAGPWTGFSLEAGNEAAARLHLARTIVRRAERRLVALAYSEPVDPMVLAFVNRASDALYAAARVETVQAGCAEEPWDPKATPGF
jgi:cob(I)alamin adenosyltransferase